MRVNSSEDLVVFSFGSSTGPFPGPEGQDPFFSTSIFRWDLFGSGASIEITISPMFLETFDPDAVPFTTAYYFPGTEAPRADHILTLPLEIFHYTYTTSIHTRITMASQAPIGTLLSPSVTPTLLPRYHVLNASIPTPMQTPYGTPGGTSSSGNSPPSFIPTLPQPPFIGPFPSSIGGTNSSGTIPSFTPNYQIPVGGKFHQGGLTQPPLVGKIPIRTQIPIGTQPPPTPPYGQNIPPSLAQYWNHLIQHNPQSTGGKQLPAISVIPLSIGQPYPGTLNPIWGSNAQTHIPV
jgi:hypothetical protein